MSTVLDFHRARPLPAPFWARRLTHALPSAEYDKLAREYEFFRRFYPWEKNRRYKMELTSVGSNALSRLIFGSPEMIEKASELTGLPLLPFIQLGFHFHDRSRPDGQIHHDYAYVKRGKTISRNLPSLTFAKRAKYARALTVLYYLGNDWAGERSDGGTALYVADPALRKNPFSSAAYVPPMNNTALIFECSPNSWHGFTRNSQGPRRSIAIWYLAPAEAMRKKYGVAPFYYEDSIEKTLAYFRRRSKGG